MVSQVRLKLSIGQCAQGRFVVHRISPEEASYKLVKVRRLQVGKGKVPFIATHDGRTIRYPDPDIRVCC